jgi:hypothetical protein
MKYLTRMPAEYQLCSVRRIYQTHKKVISVPEVREWLKVNAKEWLN